VKTGSRKLAVKLASKGLIAVLALTVTAPAQSASQVRIKRTIVVSIPDRRLAVLEDGDVIASFPVAVGAAASPSPTGEFEIVNRVQRPTYYHEGLVVPPGKDNPIGTRWVGLSEKGFGIHGTNAPKSIGHAASHGCIRLRNRDMERLFTMLRVGDVVEIHGERDEQTAEIFGGDVDGRTLAVARTEPLQAGGGQ
jgi:L,D-transpeptidase ErfK/SrfK